MISVSVQADLREARKMFRELGPGVDRAASRALNDAMTTVIAKGAREMKKTLPGLNVSTIKSHIKRQRATFRRLSTDIWTSGFPLSGHLFKPAATRKGITVKLGKRRTLARVGSRKAFQVAKFGTKVFVRRSSTDRRIRLFRGPSLPGVFRARTAEFQRIARERWAVTFPSRLRFEIEKASAKAASR